LQGEYLTHPFEFDLLQNTVSLIVCNLPVVAASLFNLKSTTMDEDIKPFSTVRFKSVVSKNWARKTTNTVDITTTVALDELRDHDTYGTASTLDALKTFDGKDDIGIKSSPGLPPPVHVVEYTRSVNDHGKWEDGPDGGTPFGTYYKSASTSVLGVEEKGIPVNPPATRPGNEPADTVSRVVFAELPPTSRR
jgi:hypothetical protein